MGVADAIANLLCVFKIAEKKDAKLINNKNGKVILVKVMANSIFCASPSNPGAIRNTNNGISISMMIINKNKPKISKLKILLAKFSDNFFLFNRDEQLGTNAALKAPSENNLLNVLGILNATKKASAKGPTPRNAAINMSLTQPKNLLIIVKKLNVPVDLIRFINHISHKFAPFVYLITIDEKN